MGRIAVGTRLPVRDSDGSRSVDRCSGDTRVPSEPRSVGNGPASPDEVDSVFAWATAALLGDGPDLDVDLCPRVRAAIRRGRQS